MGSNHTYRYLNIEVDDSAIEPADLADTLEASSWQAIAYHASIGDLSDYFSIGDQKFVTITNNKTQPIFATQANYMYIADFNHDDNVGTVDFISMYCLNETAKYNTADYYGCMSKYGWHASEIRAVLYEDVYRGLPSDLQKYIVPKYIYCAGARYENNGDNNRFYGSYSKVWLPSATELGYSSSSIYAAESSTQSVYPVFLNSSGLVDSSKLKRKTYAGRNDISNVSNYMSLSINNSCYHVGCYGSGSYLSYSPGMPHNYIFGFRLGKKS